MSSEKHADPAEIPASLTDTYDIGETLGTGHFSKVKLGINKSTKEKVLKHLDKLDKAAAGA